MSLVLALLVFAASLSVSNPPSTASALSGTPRTDESERTRVWPAVGAGGVPSLAVPARGASRLVAASTPAFAPGEASSIRSTIASWYAAPGLVAAAPWWRFGDKRVWATVCRLDDAERCVSVIVQDHCQCLVGTPGERAIDLSRSAFARLASPSVGLIRVTVEVGPKAELPATDTVR